VNPEPLRLSPESVRGRTRGGLRREEWVCEGARPAMDPSMQARQGDRGLVPSLSWCPPSARHQHEASPARSLASTKPRQHEAPPARSLASSTRSIFPIRSGRPSNRGSLRSAPAATGASIRSGRPGSRPSRKIESQQYVAAYNGLGPIGLHRAAQNGRTKWHAK